MRGYFFIYNRTLQSGNKIYYYQAYKTVNDIIAVLKIITDVALTDDVLIQIFGLL